MNVACIKIRWITTTCFEVVLPNGKVLVFDPWCGKSTTCTDMNLETGFRVDDFTGADYVFLSHTHYDHIDDVKELIAKKSTDPYGGHVFVPALSAQMFAECHNFPIVNLIPEFPYEKFHLDDLTVTVLPCRHFLDKGIFVNTAPAENMRIGRERGFDQKFLKLENMGSLEEVDLAIAVPETNFRFMVLGGRIYRFNNIYKFCEDFQPSFVIRQVSVGATPKDYAEMVARYHAPIVFPSHHDSHHLEDAQHMSYEAYFAEVNRILREMGSQTMVVNIRPLQWYRIGAFCEEA